MPIDMSVFKAGSDAPVQRQQSSGVTDAVIKLLKESKGAMTQKELAVAVTSYLKETRNRESDVRPQHVRSVLMKQIENGTVIRKACDVEENGNVVSRVYYAWIGKK